MSVRVSVFYGGEGRFDMDYYLGTHMQLVYDLLKPHGLERIEGDKGVGGGAPGQPAPYVAVGHLVFPSLKEFQEGFGAVGKQIRDDVANYTDLKSTIQVSEVATVLP
jgi:uncharacterized protein (TIGR02118 family)